ncbi:hypothetical protein GCM10028895_07530 [Pontibacter rugosus]
MKDGLNPVYNTSQKITPATQALIESTSPSFVCLYFNTYLASHRPYTIAEKYLTKAALYK